MKMYNEKEQAEQGKLQNVNFEEKKNTKKWNGAKFCVQGDKQIKKWNKGSGNLKARSHPAKFPTCEKELKKSLDPGVVGHSFNSSTGKAEAGGFLSLRPAWSKEQVQGQPSLGSEGKQKAGEDVI